MSIKWDEVKTRQTEAEMALRNRDEELDALREESLSLNKSANELLLAYESLKMDMTQQINYNQELKNYLDRVLQKMVNYQTGILTLERHKDSLKRDVRQKQRQTDCFEVKLSEAEQRIHFLENQLRLKDAKEAQMLKKLEEVSFSFMLYLIQICPYFLFLLNVLSVVLRYFRFRSYAI